MRFSTLLIPLSFLLFACSGPKTDDVPQPLDAQPTVMTWADLLERTKPSPSQSLTFGDGETDIVDVWLPEGAGPHPVVLMVHGGCWQKEIADRTLMNYAAEALRKDGLAVWNIEYRGVDEVGGGYPGTFSDVSRAADALIMQGPDLNLDTSRVAAFGHSAGGHLALWLAARPTLPSDHLLYRQSPLMLSGVVNSGGLPDLAASKPVTQASCLSDIMDKLIASDRANPLADTSPAEMLPLGTRQISVNGDRDHIAPPSLGEAYTARARDAGDDAHVHIIENTGHVELIAPGSAAFAEQTRLLKQILGVAD